jgi:CP family cyanate transporter-like MFS transporter
MIIEADRRVGSWLVVVGVMALALNLRPVVNSVGSVLPQMREALNLSATAGGVLTSVPPLCFATVGLLGPALAARFGTERVLVTALAALTVGQFVRVVGSTALLFGGSVLALCGLALCNVLLPSVIRRHFPSRIPLMTSVYTVGLATGATVASAASVPIENALDSGWEVGLGVWAVTGAIALIPWLAVAIPAGKAALSTSQRAVAVRSLLRSPVAWTLAVFFGFQSAQAYIVVAWLSQIVVDGGGGLEQGGYAVAVFSALGIPMSALVPALLRAPLAAVIPLLGGFYIAGYVGLLINPLGGIWVWAALIGVGMTSFPLALTLIALRARTTSGVAALSAFTQSVGYSIAALGPIAIGALRDIAGGWTVPLITLIGMAVVMIAAGLRAARPRSIEDDLRI